MVIDAAYQWEDRAADILSKIKDKGLRSFTRAYTRQPNAEMKDLMSFLSYYRNSTMMKCERRQQDIWKRFEKAFITRVAFF